MCFLQNVSGRWSQIKKKMLAWRFPFRAWHQGPFTSSGGSDQMVWKIGDQFLTESASLFETTVSDRVFSNAALILFWNKTDLFEEKVQMGEHHRWLLRIWKGSSLLKRHPKTPSGVQYLLLLLTNSRTSRRSPYTSASRTISAEHPPCFARRSWRC